MSNTQEEQEQPGNMGRRWFAGLAALGGLGLLGAGAQAHGWRRHGADGEHSARRIERRMERHRRG